MLKRVKRKKWKSENDRGQYYYWMGKVFEELEARKNKILLVRIFRTKWRGRTVGYYDPKTDSIYIDINCDIIPTLIHEALHAYFAPWDIKREESSVKEIEAAMVRKNYLTAGHMVRLSKYLLTKNGLFAKKFPLMYF